MEKEKSKLPDYVDSESKLPLMVDNRFYISDGEELLKYTKKLTMKDAILQMCQNSSKELFLCVTGFFHPLGWRLLSTDLKVFKEVQILIGKPYVIPADTEESLKLTYQSLLEDIPVSELHLWEFIPDLIDWLKKDYVQVRLHEYPFLHGKMYWTLQATYIGSSNLTEAGLEKNCELNVLITNPNQIQMVKKWFEDRWKDSTSTDYKSALIETLDKSRFGSFPYLPLIVYMKAVYEYYKEFINEEPAKKRASIQLAKFQRAGVNKAKTILAIHGGVMIADSVGLGKSFLLMAILDESNPRRALLIAPAQLRDSWQRNLDEKNLDRVVEFYSAEKLSKEIPTKYSGEAYDYDFIAIDESHNFRNPNTKRYRNLMRLLQQGRLLKKIILLTATPINTSMMDLYHQIKIITKGVDMMPSLQDIGIANLRDYFNDVMRSSSDPARKEIDPLKQNLMIARSRGEIRFRQDYLKEDIMLPTADGLGKKIQFPKRALPPVIYSIFPSLPDDQTPSSSNDAASFYEEIGDLLDKLHLPAVTIENYKKMEYQDPKVLKRTLAIQRMLRVMFLKRLESSIVSFIDSIKIQRILAANLEGGLDQGILISSAFIRKFFQESVEREEDIDLSDILENMDVDTIEKLKDAKFIRPLNLTEFENFDKIIEDLQEDEVNFNKILELASQFEVDLKIEKLKEILLKHPIKSTENPEKTLIFTYFKTTAKYLFNTLKNDTNWLSEIGNPKIELIHGGIDDDSRTEIVKKFAPRSNSTESAPIDSRYFENPVDILISTDVLSEGQNLQDAKYLINFDLHWNPVRLIQRTGRIDRIGARHDNISIFNFLPENGLEILLKLEERVEKRLIDIDGTMELDGDTLKENDARAQREKDYARMMQGDVSLLDDQEKFVDIGTFDLAKKLLLQDMKERSDNFYSEIPCGIHSWMIHPNISGMAVVFEQTRGETRTVRWAFNPDPEFVSQYVLQRGLLFNKEFVEPLIRCSKNTEGRGPRKKEPEPITKTFERIKEILVNAEQIIKEDFAIHDTNKKRQFEKGNKKYYDIIADGVEDNLITRKEAKNFLEYLENNAFQRIRNDPDVFNAINHGQSVI